MLVVTSNSLFFAECEEYKHRVKKRASIITYVFGGVSSLGKEFPHMVSAQIVDLNHD